MASPTPGSDPHQSFPQVRKRTRIACDKCSSFRVRCDGQLPCRRCQEYGHSCHYARDIKKRGRKPAAHKHARSHGLEIQSPENHLSPPSIAEDGLTPGSAIGEQNALESRSDEDGSEIYAAAGSSPHIPRSHPDGVSHQRSESAGTGMGASQIGLFKNGLSHGESKHSFPGSLSFPEPVLPPRRASQSIRRISQLINHPQPPVQPQHNDLGGFRTPYAPMSKDAGSSPGQTFNRDPQIIGLPGSETAHCRYKCLEPILPLLHGIIEPDVACDLLEFYFAEPDSSLFRTASPYVLTHVLRKRSLLHATNPRKTSPALLVTMLWVSVQTADMPILLLPGWRGNISEELRKLAMSLVHDRDRDHWHRASGGRSVKEEHFYTEVSESNFGVPRVDDQAPCHSIDDVLTLILLTIVISGGDFKTDCLVWWSKAVRLVQAMGLNLEDGRCGDTNASCMNVHCDCRARNSMALSLQSIESQEERRRVFWLVFSLDRHLALSYNGNLFITDDECRVYSPLPDEIWEQLELIPAEQLTHRVYGPPTLVTGTGFFEYFLPLMATLGDVIQIHHRRCHPRLGLLDDRDAVSLVEKQLASLAQSINDLSNFHHLERLDTNIPASHASGNILTPSTTYSDDPMSLLPPSSIIGASTTHTQGPVPMSKFSQQRRKSRIAQAQLVTAYSTFILHVLHVLLHGKWDAVSMLSSSTDPTISDWITSPSFVHCASHAIHASGAVSKILLADPELTFMPYLFGIYLLHGSFILLLFADRMPQVGGPNESVETACETIIRAHEVCVVTLSTEFQKRFRKVLRSTLYSVKEGIVSGAGNSVNEVGDGGGSERVRIHERNGSLDLGPDKSGGTDEQPVRNADISSGRNIEEGKARRRVLSLYRWTSGSRGLAL